MPSSLNFCALVENTSLPPGASSAMQLIDQLGVIALHIEDVLHALAVGKRGRIEKNQVVGAPLGHGILEPGDAVGLDEFMVASRNVIHCQIALSPIEVGG